MSKPKICIHQNSKVFDIVDSLEPYTEIKTQYGTLSLYRTKDNDRLYVVVDGFHYASYDEVDFVIEPLAWFGDLVGEIMVSMFPHRYLEVSSDLLKTGVLREFSARRLRDGSFEYDSIFPKKDLKH